MYLSKITRRLTQIHFFPKRLAKPNNTKKGDSDLKLLQYYDLSTQVLIYTIHNEKIV